MLDPNDIHHYILLTHAHLCACGRATHTTEPQVVYSAGGTRNGFHTVTMLANEPLYQGKPILVKTITKNIPICASCINDAPRLTWTARQARPVSPQHSNLASPAGPTTKAAASTPRKSPEASLEDLLGKL